MPDDEASSPNPQKAVPSQQPRGTFNFWIDGEEHPDAFEPGIRQRWGDFQFGGEICVVCSDGPTLAATLRMGSEKRVHLFRIPFRLPRTRRRHLVTIGWKKGQMKILLDSKIVAEVPATFILWFAFVSGLLL